MSPYLAYPPDFWNVDMLMFMGLIVIALAVAAVVVLLIWRRSSIALRSQALAGGLALGLAGGLLGGIAFVFAQSRNSPGYLLPPFDFKAGVFTGIGVSALLPIACGALTYLHLRRAPLIGVLVGMVAGLAVFRVLFGPTVGFGGELDEGFGSEIGVMFGAAGGLMGGITGHVINIATANMRAFPSHIVIDASTPVRPGWSWPLIGLVLGSLGATLIGALGASIGIFQLLVPYHTQTPDSGRDLSTTAALNNVLFGLSIFAVGGALIGCFLALQRMTAEGRGAQRYALWAGVGLVAGLICGIGFGLNVAGFGGPLITPTPLNYVPDPHPDPSGGVRGLLVGLVSGALLGILLLVLAGSRRLPSRWTLVIRESAALIVGMLALTFPLWYTPFWGIAIH
jgi:hypothetical protein